MPRSVVTIPVYKERSPSKEAYNRTAETMTGPNVRISLPQASIGTVVPFLLGRKRVVPNLIWIGGAEPVYEVKQEITKTTEDVVEEIGPYDITTIYETTTTVTTRTIVGYSLHMALGLCLGPGVHLRAIHSQDAVLWSGDVGPTPGDITLAVNETAYSGIEATFYGGNFDQTVDPTMAISPDMSAHVGVAYIVLKNVRSDLPLDNITFEVERFPDPLAIGVNNMVGSFDLNIATILTEVLTNVWGAGGLNISEVDTATMIAAATILKGENNGGSMLITSEDRVTALIDVIQDQMDAILFPDISNGKLKLTLIRPNLVTSLTAFGRRDIIEIRGQDRDSWSNTIEQLRSSYINRDLDYGATPVFVLNPAKLRQSTRGRRTGELSYPLVHSVELAQQLLHRDLKRYGFPAFTNTVVLNRAGADIEPGDIIQLSYPKWPSFVNVAVLVLKVRKSVMTENNVYLTVQQIYLPDMENLTDEPAEGDTTSVDYQPETPTSAHILTAPYWIARAANGVTTTVRDPSVPAIVLAAPADEFQFSYEVYLRNKPGSLGEIRLAGPSAYSTSGKLVANLSMYEGYEDGVISAIQIDDVINDAYLVSVSEDGVRSGQQFLIIGDEILSFETAIQISPAGVWELQNVHRGLLDTVAANHGEDDDIFIIGNNYTNLTVGFKLPIGYTPEFGIRSNTLFHRGQPADDLVTSSWSESNNRVWSPLRPHDTRVEGERSPDTFLTLGDSVEVTWKTRSRTSPVVSLQTDDAEIGEISTTAEYQHHRVVLIDSLATVWDLGATDDESHANSLIVTIPAGAANGLGFLHVQAELDGRISLQHDRIPVTLISGSFVLVTEDHGFALTTESGDYLVGE